MTDGGEGGGSPLVLEAAASDGGLATVRVCGAEPRRAAAASAACVAVLLVVVSSGGEAAPLGSRSRGAAASAAQYSQQCAAPYETLGSPSACCEAADDSSALWGSANPGSGALCEGDCDNDGECGAGLRCFQREYDTEIVPGCGAGGATSSSVWDYCYDPYADPSADPNDPSHSPGADGQQCFGDSWRAQNKQLRHARDGAGGAAASRLRRCDAGRGDGGPEGVTFTGVGGRRWYRFASSTGGLSYDSLPTQPTRALGVQTSQQRRPWQQSTGVCGGNVDATAWLSGWDPDATGAPPENYDVPGSLPGDGPQDFWKEHTVCFEGELPVAISSGRPPPPPGPGQVVGGLMTAGVLYELWTGIDGGMLTDLSSSSYFPRSPSQRELYSDDHTVESPTDIGSHLATRIRGYFKAPQDGCYTFHLSSDDDGELWMGGTGEEGEELVPTLVANVPGWTSSREWQKYPEQTTSPASLIAGRYYLLDAFAKENEGGDNLAVGVTLPDGTFLGPIPVSGYMYLDQALLRTAHTPVVPHASDGDGGEDGEGDGDDSSSAGGISLPSNYRPCLASVRVNVTRCDGFVLFQLPDSPSCDPTTMAYCTAPSVV